MRASHAYETTDQGGQVCLREGVLTQIKTHYRKILAILLFFTVFETQHDKIKMTCAPSKDSDQLVHPLNLHYPHEENWVLSFLFSTFQRFSDCMDVQADPSLYWEQLFCWVLSCCGSVCTGTPTLPPSVCCLHSLTGSWKQTCLFPTIKQRKVRKNFFFQALLINSNVS